jgi:hypothetical protein
VSIFDNLTRLVTAPIEVVDKLVLEPLADAADMVTEGLGIKDEKR